MGSPFRELTPGERDFLQAVTNDIYDQFVNTVLESRNIPESRTAEIAEGKIFTGRQALDLGLVDCLGGEEEAVALAAKLSGIEGKPAVVFAREKKAGLLRYLLEESAHFFATEFQEGFPGMAYRMSPSFPLKK